MDPVLPGIILWIGINCSGMACTVVQTSAHPDLATCKAFLDAARLGSDPHNVGICRPRHGGELISGEPGYGK